VGGTDPHSVGGGFCRLLGDRDAPGTSIGNVKNLCIGRIRKKILGLYQKSTSGGGEMSGFPTKTGADLGIDLTQARKSVSEALHRAREPSGQTLV